MRRGGGGGSWDGGWRVCGKLGVDVPVAVDVAADVDVGMGESCTG